MMSLRSVRLKSKTKNYSEEHEESVFIEVDNDPSYQMPSAVDSDETNSNSSRGEAGAVVKEQQENTGGQEERSEAQETSQKREKKSIIWRYFEFISKNRYQCILCFRTLNHVGGSTSNFYRHMRSKHPSHPISSSPKKRQKAIVEYFVDGEIVKDDPPPPHETSGVDIHGTNSTSLGETAGVREQQEKSELQEKSEELQENSEELQEKSEKQRKKSDRKSKIWSYFELISKNKYQCILCTEKLKYSGSSANLYRHIRNIHSLEPLSPLKETTQEVAIHCYGDTRTDKDDAVEEMEKSERSKETTTSSHVDDTIYDASQPWRFFEILTGNASCRLCFRSLSYSSIADLAVLVNHLQLKHSICFQKYDSANLIEVVNSDEACSNDLSSRDSAFPNVAGELQKKFEIYFTDFDDYSATCKMCLSSVSFTRNRKSLISHLYKEHKKVFSKRYPTFWHISKYFSSKTSTTSSSRDNLTSNSSAQFSDDCGEGQDQQEMDIADPSESSVKHMSHPDNIGAHFSNLDKNKVKCLFCSKCIPFFGDWNMLEQHIYKEHKSDLIQKVLDEMVFDDSSDSKKATKKCTQSGQRNSSSEELLSYFKPLENLHFKCKICSKTLILENIKSLNQLSEHVWYAHISKTFKSIIFLKSFGNLALNQERSNSNNKKPAALKSEKKHSNISLDSFEWVRPVGKSSKTWRYFLTPKNELPYAKCRLCNIVLSIKTANISNLARHLNLRHNDKLRTNLNMCYENGRMFCKDSKRKIAKKYSMRELRKSLQCRLCFAHFSEWKSFCKHIRCKHKNYNYNKEICIAKTYSLKKVSVSKVTTNKKIQNVKCKLCEEYLLCSGRETFKKHMKEKHTNAYNMGVGFSKYKESEKKILTLNDEMDVVIESSSTNRGIVLKNKSHMSTFFAKSGSSYAKCKICRKFISKSIHCRHKVPLIFSLTFGVQSMNRSLTAGSKSGIKKIPSRIYCCSVNMVKNYCDICLKNPMSSICRCLVNKRFVLPPLTNILAENVDVLSTQYLQDIHKSERKAYAVLFSINYFEKSCCLLCTEQIFSQGSNLLACFDHFRLKHGTLLKNLNKMSKHIERKKLFDYVDFEAVFDTPFGVINPNCDTLASDQRPFESNVISEKLSTVISDQPSNVIIEQPSNVISEQNPLILNVYSIDPTLSMDVAIENTTFSLGVDTENPSLNVGVDSETHSSVLAIASENSGLDVASEELVSEIEIIPEKLNSRNGNRRNPSSLWKFYTKVGPKTVFCNACRRVWKTYTSHNLARHLKNKHPKLALLLQQERAKKLPPGTFDNRTSDIWMHYKKCNHEWAECNKCKRYISIRGGSTGNLVRHLKSKTCINKEYDKEVLFRLTDEAVQTRKNMSSVWHYFQKLSPGKAVCSMCQHIISTKNHNISNLTRHLRNVHRVYIVPTSDLNPQVLGLEGVLDNSESVDYEYIEDEQVNNSNVITDSVNRDCQTDITSAVVESGNYLLEETFPNFIAEEVVGALDPIQKNDSVGVDIPETISLNALFKKVYRSPTWNYFTKLNDGRVKCKLCGKTQAFKSSKCINNLTRHLKKKHASSLGPIEPKPENKEKCVLLVHDQAKTEPPDRQNRRGRTSYLWTYFTRTDDLVATCKMCQSKLSIKSSPNSNLRRHLEVKHMHILNDIKIGSLPPFK